MLDAYFPTTSSPTVIHASSKVCEGSWQWQPVAAFKKPANRPARTTGARRGAPWLNHDIGVHHLRAA